MTLLPKKSDSAFQKRANIMIKPLEKRRDYNLRTSHKEKEILTHEKHFSINNVNTMFT